MSEGPQALWCARINTQAESQTELAGRLLGSHARPGDVVALAGGLGSGKTCFVRGMALGLGIHEPVVSPTFNLLLVHSGTLPLYHFDLYRLERAEQLEDIDFYETIEAGGGVSAIEWADRFPGEMPPDRIDVAIGVSAPTDREFSITATGPVSAQLGEAWADAWDTALSLEEGTK